MARSRLRKIGQVVVDSGTIVISDPTNLKLANQAYEADDHTRQQVTFGVPGLELGIILQTGVGDDIYPVYAEFGPHPFDPSREVIRRIQIRFC